MRRALVMAFACAWTPACTTQGGSVDAGVPDVGLDRLDAPAVVADTGPEPADAAHDGGPAPDVGGGLDVGSGSDAGVGSDATPGGCVDDGDCLALERCCASTCVARWPGHCVACDVACDGARANACSLAGACVCGSGPACAPGEACSAGACVAAPVGPRRLVPGSGEGTGIATDASGNVYVTGRFDGTANFGGPPLVAPAPGSLFLVSFVGATGAHRWSRVITGSARLASSAVAVDGGGGVFLTGSFGGSLDVGLGALSATPPGPGSREPADAFLARFDAATGAPSWVLGLGGDGIDEGLGVAARGGLVVVAGGFSTTADLGGGPLVSAGWNDAFVAGYDAATGAHRWSRGFGSSLRDTSRALAIDAAGDLYAAGAFNGTIDPGGGPLTSAAAGDAFVASYAADGSHRWSRRYGGLGDDDARSIAVDASGGLYVAGSFSGSVDLGGGTLTHSASLAVFLAGLDSASATHRWSRAFGTSLSSVAYGLGANPSGRLGMTGFFWYSIDFGGGPVGASESAGFAAGFAGATGAHEWSAALDRGWGNAAAVDASGARHYTGTIMTTTDVGGRLVDSYQIFVLTIP